jgi:mannose-6-phosphate isomerase-like protein (cupin superfamily)
MSRSTMTNPDGTPTASPGAATSSAPPLPGGVGLSRLRVYDWEGPDGLRGGSPHVHLACMEAYLVLAGSGAVQTVGPGGFQHTPLERGSLVWFTPGMVHRLINEGGLEIVVLMQVATLPEVGDCILSFPEAVLREPTAYREAAGHDPGRSVAAAGEEAARRRRDLAVEGFNQLRDGTFALDRFYERAAALAAPLAPAWRAAWEEGPSAAAARAEELIAGLDDGVPPLAPALFALEPPDREVLGLCGRLDTYPFLEGTPIA